MLIVQTAIAASRKHQAQQSWLAMTQAHLLVSFHAKSTNYILDLSQSMEKIIHQMLEYCFIVGPEVYRNVSFMHHLLDGIPRLASGLAEKQHWNSYPPVQYFGHSGLVFNDLNSSNVDVISTGEDALVALYKGKPGETSSETAKVSS